MMQSSYIDDSSVVLTRDIGLAVKIWQFVVILDGTKVGNEVSICSHCFIEANVKIGNRVTIKNGVQLWEGTCVEDDVFIGPNVTLTNDRYPRSKNANSTLEPVHFKSGSSIGGGAVILPGVTIGEGAIVGAGSVVVKDVDPYSVVQGNPAKHIRFINE